MPRVGIQNFTSSLLANGTSTVVDCGSASDIAGLSAITLAAWIKFPTQEPSDAIYLCANGAFRLIFVPASSTLTLGLATTNNGWVTGGANLNYKNYTNGWHFVIANYNSALSSLQTSIYVDNALINQTGGITGNLLTPVADFFISTDTGSQRWYQGNICGVGVWNRTLSISEMQALYQSGVYPSNGLLRKYMLGEGTGTTANDTSGNGKTGTITSGAWSSDVPAATRTAVSSQPRITMQNFNCSLNFNGTSTTVALAQTSGLPLYSTSGYSIFGRFKAGVINSSSHAIYAEGNSANNTQNFIVNLVGSQVKVTLVNNAATTVLGVFATTRFASGQWYDIAWVDNNGVAVLYINGTQDASSFTYTPTGTSTFNTSAIGYLNRSSPTAYFQGNICDVQLFNYALSAAQVQQVRNGGLLGNIGNYQLGEGSGTTAYDSSGNNNNGTITSGTYTSDVPSNSRSLVGGNLVYNGGFEFAPPTNVAQTAINFANGTSGGSSTVTVFGWGLKSIISGSVSVLFDNSTSHSGCYSLKVSTTATGSYAQASNNISLGVVAPNSFCSIPVLPSTSYTLSYWMKTTANSGSAVTGAFAGVNERSSSGAAGTGHNSTGITTTTGWTQYTLLFTTASTAAFVWISLNVSGSDGTGTLIMDAWFDDFILVPNVTSLRSTAV